MINTQSLTLAKAGIDWDYGIADVSTPPPGMGEIAPTAVDSTPR